MEIRSMVLDLNTKAKRLEEDIGKLTQLAENLRTQLTATEATLRTQTDDLTGIRMAIESLEMVGHPRERPEPENPKPVLATKGESKPQPKENPRKAKKIVKLSPSGKELRIYSSINMCAKDLGWMNTGTKKYIESNSEEKQLKMKGFILRFTA